MVIKETDNPNGYTFKTYACGKTVQRGGFHGYKLIRTTDEWCPVCLKAFEALGIPKTGDPLYPYWTLPDTEQTMIDILKRVQVEGYTYETNLPVKVGDRVLLPTPEWLQIAKGPTWEGKVTSLEPGDYKGPCLRIIRILE